MFLIPCLIGPKYFPKKDSCSAQQVEHSCFSVFSDKSDLEHKSGKLAFPALLTINKRD